ncbi:MAG: SUMF1/EgtB/PvdO family nonheme iron enzyme [Candidatus Fibromonas sp.]|jgi:hypothetical protein|nr:SUMF1/EgtB/PvdO family nonheme iron enzyme [Candidatus Fibromonas sp.]
MKKLIRGMVEITAAFWLAVVVMVILGGFGIESVIFDGLNSLFLGGRGSFTFTIIFLLLLAGGIVASVFLVKIKRIRLLLVGCLALTTGLVLAPIFTHLMFALMLSYEEYDTAVLDDGKLEIMELDKFKSFSGKENNEYYFKVLIKSPPKNIDSLKNLMARYFYKKAQYIKVFDPGSYLGSVHFYKYTRGNASFIDDDENHSGFYTNYLDKYPETKIGSISTQNNYDEMIVYNKNRKATDTIIDTLYRECNVYETAAADLPVSNSLPLTMRKNEISPDEISPKDVSANPDSIAMVLVEGGPLNNDTAISDFYIGKYETTQGLWKAVMGNNPSHFTGNDNLPVEMVSWDDIQIFIEKLNRKTGKNYRLPVEVEWEYAANGGNKNKKYRYCNGDSIGDVAWHKKNSHGQTHLVGTKQANELGIHDMSGNVWEWVTIRDYVLDEYSRAFLGGSWNFSKWYCSKRGYTSIPRHSYLGFRLARDP